MKIKFLGATQTVTGSKYLITTEHTKILVDCGLFQGIKELRLRNWQQLPFNPKSIQYVLLTHAHIDHSGYIPLLVKNGFRGKILCTKATRDLSEILLPDSGHLHEEEAKFANKYKYSKHNPALPLYTQEDAQKALEYFHTVEFDKPFKINNDITVTFQYAGHILGASFIQIKTQSKSILFSGDLGRVNDPIMKPPKPPLTSDYYVVESTYGDRLHDDEDPKTKLADIINKTSANGGSIIIPSFAVGRAQNILYYIYQLKLNNLIPDIPVFIDSPMATDATELFCKHSDQHKLSRDETRTVCQTAKYTRTVEESKELDKQKMPIIIISASGMATGGRILHHLRYFAPNHRNAIVFCGYQAIQTRGEKILNGAKTIKIFGEEVPIKASVYELTNTSAHADYEGIINWLKQLKEAPKKVFLTHGESKSSEALRDKIEKTLNFRCEIPTHEYEITL